MPLDVCTPPDITWKKAYSAMKTTHDWALKAGNTGLAAGMNGAVIYSA